MTSYHLAKADAAYREKQEKFREWKKEVDVALSLNLGGLTSDCISDYDYWNAFDAGDSPEEAAKDAAMNDSDGMFDDLIEDLFS